MAPWRGPRHRSWAADSNLIGYFAISIFATYVVWEALGTAPSALVNLLGPTVGVWFASAASDQKKRRDDTERTAERANVTAHRAEDKANALANVAQQKHPEATRELRPPFHGEEQDRDD